MELEVENESKRGRHRCVRPPNKVVWKLWGWLRSQERTQASGTLAGRGALAFREGNAKGDSLAREKGPAIQEVIESHPIKTRSKRWVCPFP